MKIGKLLVLLLIAAVAAASGCIREDYKTLREGNFSIEYPNWKLDENAMKQKNVILTVVGDYAVTVNKDEYLAERTLDAYVGALVSYLREVNVQAGFIERRSDYAVILVNFTQNNDTFYSLERFIECNSRVYNVAFSRNAPIPLEDEKIMHVFDSMVCSP